MKRENLANAAEKNSLIIIKTLYLIVYTYTLYV